MTKHGFAALAVGILVVVGFGGLAAAAEDAPNGGEVIETPTAAPVDLGDEGTDDEGIDDEADDADGEEAEAEEGDAEEAGSGLVCVLVPIESPDDTDGTDTDGTDTAGTDADGTDADGTDADGTDADGTDSEGTAPDAADEASPTLEQILAENTIECSGTGNERSAEVALVPRFLAHSEEWTGAEKAAIIRAWAKTHANKKSDGDSESSVGDTEADSGPDAENPDLEIEDSEPRRGEGGNGNGNGNGNGGQHRGHDRH